jgi:bifunctional non-homologous end joining protein LigD
MLWRVSKPARRLPLGFIQPCLAIEASRVPAGPGWVHEIKHDGYRVQLRKSGDRVRLFTRRGFDWTKRYSWVTDSAAKLRAGSLTVDGELVCAGEDGIADFSRLHSRCFDHQAFLYGFDLLELDGEDWRGRPLIERKDMLAKLLRQMAPGIRYCEHDDGDGETLFRAACRMGLEGIVSKRAQSRYRSGRCKSWVKTKNKRAPGYMRVRDGLDG